MAPHFPWLSFAFKTCLVLLSMPPFSNGSRAKEYQICSSPPRSCGNVTDFRYPFWVQNDMPGYCGLPDFRLECYIAADYPQMWIKGLQKTYKVRKIDTSARTILIGRDKNQTCNHALVTSNQTFINSGRSPFTLGKSVINLTLFLDCPNTSTAVKLHSRSFLCSNPGGNLSVYHLDGGAYIGSQCPRNVTFPVSKKALDEFKSGNGIGRTLESVLEEGFEMKYNFDHFTDCQECENSTGICVSALGIPSGEFVCYRPDNKRYVSLLTLIYGLGITGGSVLIIALLAFCFRKKLKFCCSNFISRSDSLHATASDLERGSLYFGVPLFSYKDLKEATNNFDESRELGDGGFGIVYYGKLKDGREVAVKLLYEKSYRRVEQFMNEVQILTRLRHQNLVSLYGCSSPHCRELLLVYEYIRNGTVADHLYGENSKSGYLSWNTRMRIAIETASALSYLHASEIIHRDVKTNNILLDGNFSVKMADFGLSRLFPTDVTHVSTAPQGTPGYLDPEYHQCYQLTVKSDVYSFGVVLIELISSLPPIDVNRTKHEINLSNYAMSRIQRRAFEELVDPQLGFGSDFRVTRMTTCVAELAFQCLQQEKDFRPAMDEVLEVLKKVESADYNSEDSEPEDKEEVSCHTKTKPPSPTEQEDARLLISMHYHHQQMHPLSPNSIMDRWGSRSSTTASSTSTRQGSNVFYSMSN